VVVLEAVSNDAAADTSVSLHFDDLVVATEAIGCE